MNLFLQNIAESFNQNNLPADWLGVDFKEFSKQKSLFDYQQKALENALKALYLYYEQYKETLANAVYEDSDLLDSVNKSPYEQYVFLKDEKMLKALEIDYKNNKVKIDLSKLYESIDIAETLSNLTGKWIKKIKKDEIEFADGTKINPQVLDYKLIKPLIWWE